MPALDSETYRYINTYEGCEVLLDEKTGRFVATHANVIDIGPKSPLLNLSFGDQKECVRAIHWSNRVHRTLNIADVPMPAFEDTLSFSTGDAVLYENGFIVVARRQSDARWIVLEDVDGGYRAIRQRAELQRPGASSIAFAQIADATGIADLAFNNVTIVKNLLSTSGNSRGTWRIVAMNRTDVDKLKFNLGVRVAASVSIGTGLAGIDRTAHYWASRLLWPEMAHFFKSKK